MLEMTMAYGQIIIADLILSGDNALIIGMAAAGLAPKLRKRAIFYGMVIAAVLRIVFAVIATTLLGIPGILFIGSLLLFWVCWRLFQEIRSANNNQPHSDTSAMSNTDTRPCKYSVAQLRKGVTKFRKRINALPVRPKDARVDGGRSCDTNGRWHERLRCRG